MVSSIKKYFYENIFREACRTGDTTELQRIMVWVKFNSERISTNNNFQIPPLLIAIQEQSIPVVTLLLENDVEVNSSGDNWLLNEAIAQRNIELVHLLLNKGANPNLNPEKLLATVVGTDQLAMVQLLLNRIEQLQVKHLRSIIILAIKHALKRENVKTLECLLEHATRLGVNEEDDMYEEEAWTLCKYSKLLRAMISGDMVQVTQLMNSGDYETYADLSYNYPFKYRPAALAFRFGGIKMVKTFLQAKVDLPMIIKSAIKRGDLAVVEMSTASTDFDPHALVSKNENALNLACRYNQYEIIKFLMNTCKLNLEDVGEETIAPLYSISKTTVVQRLFADFPETEVNKDLYSTLLTMHSKTCDFYALFLELGADPAFGELLDNQHESCKNGEDGFTRKCKVVRYLHKMMLIDRDYVVNILTPVLDIEPRALMILESFSQKDKYQTDITKMQSVQISQGNTLVPAKSLFDFIYFGPNEVARYARNQVVLRIYEEHERDFAKFLPEYGFVLNRQLRRGTIRRDRFEAALELLCFALGTELPEDFVELIFGCFSNRTLGKFKLETATT